MGNRVGAGQVHVGEGAQFGGDEVELCFGMLLLC
jgi:hypothetical protein